MSHGSQAAAQTPADLAAARTLAEPTLPLPQVAPDARVAAELALRLTSINLNDSCREERSGYAFHKLATITWQPANAQHSGPAASDACGMT
jgi:hypothetical protein